MRLSNRKIIIEDINAKSTNSQWRKNLTIELKFSEKLKLLFTNKAYVYLLIAAFFRFAGGYSLGYWATSFFQAAYPDKQSLYSEVYFIILLTGGIPSEMIGGWICDKFEPRVNGIKGIVSASGAALGSIFIILTFYIKTTFAWAMVFYYFEYLTAEVFFGPAYAQINKLVASQMQGLGVAIF